MNPNEALDPTVSIPTIKRSKNLFLALFCSIFFITIGLLNTYANFKLGIFPTLLNHAGWIGGLTFLVWPLMPDFLLLGGFIYFFRVIKLFKIQNKVYKNDFNQGLGFLGGILGFLTGILFTLMLCWVLASITASKTVERYQAEVQAFQWLYDIPGPSYKLEVKNGVLMSSSSNHSFEPSNYAEDVLKNPGNHFALDSDSCRSARSLLNSWVKNPHDTFDMVLQQQMVFLNYQHGCLSPQSVFDFNELLKQKALKIHSRMDIIFPWLYSKENESMINTLNITPSQWCDLNQGKDLKSKDLEGFHLDDCNKIPQNHPIMSNVSNPSMSNPSMSKTQDISKKSSPHPN